MLLSSSLTIKILLFVCRTLTLRRTSIHVIDALHLVYKALVDGETPEWIHDGNDERTRHWKGAHACRSPMTALSWN